MKVLIGGLGEVVLTEATGVNAQFIHDHLVVEIIGVTSISSQIITNQVFGLPLVRVRHSTLRKIVVLINDIARTQYLWFGAKILLLILREVIHRPLVHVERAQILVIIRILMVVERVHAFVCAVNRFGFVWDLHAALIKNLVDVFRVQILQIIKIN